MDKHIVIPNHYSFVDHDVFDFDKTLSIYDWDIKSEDVVLDLSGCSRANYQALALVIPYLWHLSANECRIRTRFAPDKKGASLMWMHMGAGEWTKVLEGEQYNFDSAAHKPLLALRDNRDFTAALSKADAYTKGFNVEYEKTLRYVISELLYNTLEHGKRYRTVAGIERQIPSIASFTWYRLRNELQFIIADIGIGIKKHLEQTYPKFSSDEEAIRTALRPHVSGTFGRSDPYTSKDNAGVGLYLSSNIIKRLNADMHIVSGRGVVHISPMDITAHKLKNHWPGTYVLVRMQLGRSANLNLHSLMSEFRAAADKEVEAAEKEEASNKIRVVVEHFFGRYAENKEAAIAYRNRYIVPALDRGQSVVIDFENVLSAPHSFLSAMIATPVQRLGMAAYKKIKVVNATPEIRETIDFIIDENTPDK